MRLSAELRAGLRGIRARGWRGAFVVALLGLALAANTLVFSATDSFVLRRAPYPQASRLVEIGSQGTLSWSPAILPETVSVWRGFTDLFSSFHAYVSPAGSAYVTGGEGPRFVQAAQVSPGLLDILGAVPIAGRLFVPSDAHAYPWSVVIVAEEIARQEFGSPQRALGKALRVGTTSPMIVGVLPFSFRFPTGNQRFWMPLDVVSQGPSNFVRTLAQMAPGQSVASISAAVGGRAEAVRAQATPPWNRAGNASMDARGIEPSRVDPQLSRLFILLCAAAGCLLLVTCANVINLELATALTRVQTHAVELALGASRGRLVRTALIEGAACLLGATALGGVLVYPVTAFVSRHLPDRLTATLANGLDVDSRALAFMVGIAALTWLLTSLPVAVMAARTNVLDTLNLDTRTLSGSRMGRRVRQVLTVAEIATTVLMLIGALLTVQSYAALLAIPKGFDTVGVVSMEIRQKPGDSETRTDLHERVLASLRGRPEVVAVSVGVSPPAAAASISTRMTITGQSEPVGLVTLGLYDADADYFGKTMRLPLRAGREFQPRDPPNSVIVDDAFAKKFWPAGDALGAEFRLNGSGWDGVGSAGFRIVGVAQHVRTLRDSVLAPSEDFLPIYKPLAGTTLRYAVRLIDPGDADDIANMVRALAPGAIVGVQTIRARYAELFANEQLAAAIMVAFGGFAFLVAMAGIYGVMAFLVAARTREIGIRLAVGADRRAIARLVLGSSARLVAYGVIIGAGMAFGAARWAGSLLFGISATDPWTYVIVVGAVMITGVVATWHPARKAARIDPSRLLRE